ncbi:VOC family protein [Sphaerisporangium sp. TRM90804]|uniref:VOC family protein n=1 Tax=Sphaerisporangium sp. TRM90804 TaxID=3031113 RepID=UPI002446F38B|nr:VOC family protein [Sphaerisporangium sp. TRM90804]MDH2430231.1 VOC family protein [Sphaerisporangium sp. TRM90804]
MPTRTGYPHGVPCWVDLSSPDVGASVDFYGELFGWRAQFDPHPDAGGYGRFTSRGMLVAGIGPRFARGAAEWSLYVATGDAESVESRVKEAGGAVVIGPVQVFEEGVTALFHDPAGAAFMVWQAGRHHGARLVGEPWALCWAELRSPDPQEARAFYPHVFGWASRGARGAEGVEWLVDGRAVAGMRPAGDARAPAGWLSFFAVRDCDAAADLASGRGGAVLAAPEDSPAGRRAVLADPQGAAFGVLAPLPAR